MTDKNPTTLHNWAAANDGKPFTLIVAAGFEERSRTIPEYFCSAGDASDSTIIIVEYKDGVSPGENFKGLLKKIQQSFGKVITLDMEDISSIAGLTQEDKKNGENVVLDISGFSRINIFKLLYMLTKDNIKSHLAYTEAEEYYPSYDYYNKLKMAESSEEILKIYEDLEESDIIYSYDCDVLIPSEFIGSPEPDLESALIGFLTFKRSRLQAVLRALEFNDRVLILSQPVREDLAWRMELMELVNKDLIEDRSNECMILSTLNAHDVAKKLKSLYHDNQLFYKKNVYLTPLGSKMQTVGAFLFWNEHREITVVFSQPRKYFEEKFSSGHKDSFIMPFV